MCWVCCVHVCWVCCVHVCWVCCVHDALRNYQLRIYHDHRKKSVHSGFPKLIEIMHHNVSSFSFMFCKRAASLRSTCHLQTQVKIQPALSVLALHCIVLGREWHVTLCTYVCMYAPALTPFPITTVVQSWRVGAGV